MMNYWSMNIYINIFITNHISLSEVCVVAVSWLAFIMCSVEYSLTKLLSVFLYVCTLIINMYSYAHIVRNGICNILCLVPLARQYNSDLNCRPNHMHTNGFMN